MQERLDIRGKEEMKRHGSNKTECDPFILSVSVL